MSLLSYLSEYPGTLNDKTLAWLKSWSPGFENGTTEDLWMLYLSQYSGSLNDRMLQWARTATSLPTASLGDALNALPDAGASYGGASLDLNFASQTYNAGAIGDIPPSVPFSSLVTFTRASSGTYFDAAGVLQTAANDAPRFDYDPVTLQPRGLLIEEARTNLLTYSEDLTNVAWAKSGATVSPDLIASPSGVLNADKIVETAASAPHRVTGANTSITEGVTYTASVFVKSAGNNRKLEFRNYTGASDVITIVDPDAGTVVSGPGTLVSIGSGWYRLSHTFTAAATVTSIFVFQCYLNNGGSTYPGDGTSGIYIWGAQLEAGAFPTSYIPTEASQVTRAADVASVNTLSPWYNATEGTLFVEGNATQKPVAASTFYTAACIEGPSSGYIAIRQRAQSSEMQAIVELLGVPQANFLRPYTADFKCSMSFALNDFGMSLNGQPVITDTSGTLPSTVRLMIGSEQGGVTRILNGHIRTIRYFPRKLSNTELQAITV